MNFGEQFRSARRERDLTQGQMAEALGVSRQAVSNWENDRNLPDIEMLIRMSRAFGLSLDQLILGGSDKGNMADKLIRDGSETRRARFASVSVCVGATLLLLGFACIALKALSVEYVDSDGLLHESFFLLPMGFSFLFGGFAAFLSTGVRSVVSLARRRSDGKRDDRLIVIVSVFVVVVRLAVGALLYAANSGMLR